MYKHKYCRKFTSAFLRERLHFQLHLVLLRCVYIHIYGARMLFFMVCELCLENVRIVRFAVRHLCVWFLHAGERCPSVHVLLLNQRDFRMFFFCWIFCQCTKLERKTLIRRNFLNCIHIWSFFFTQVYTLNNHNAACRRSNKQIVNTSTALICINTTIIIITYNTIYRHIRIINKSINQNQPIVCFACVVKVTSLHRLVKLTLSALW